MKRYRISEICDILGGGTPKTTIPEYWNGDIPWLSVKDFNNDDAYVYETEKKITQEGLKHCSATLLEKDDIVISARGTVGALTLIPFPMTFNQSCYGLRGKRELVDKHYLFYKLKNSFQSFLANSHGSVFNTITRDTFNNICIQLPDLSEQQRIAKILSIIDAKIELNKKINRELEIMAKELYDYWFVQFDFPNEQGKPYKSSGGKMVWNETLKREIPEGWEVKKLGDCLEHINTGLNPRDNFKLGNGNIKYVTVKNIAMDGSIDFSGCDYVNEEARKMIHARSKISKGDILFASISPLGRCFILHEEPKDWDINESVFSIRPRSIINSEYLYEYFRSEWFIKKSEKVATGSIFSGIRIQVLTSLPILIPDKSIIGDFWTKLANLLCQKEKFSQENMILTNLRNQLLPLLMNGQVRVSEEKVSSVLQKDDTNRFILWKNTYPVAARGEKNDTVLRAMYEAMDDEDK